LPAGWLDRGGGTPVLGEVDRQKEKMFFFEKKNQKTFGFLAFLSA
jgi:hypothetical protein